MYTAFSEAALTNTHVYLKSKTLIFSKRVYCKRSGTLNFNVYLYLADTNLNKNLSTKSDTNIDIAQQHSVYYTVQASLFYIQLILLNKDWIDLTFNFPTIGWFE